MNNKYYHTCKTCGANLDPGEVCSDCKEQNDKITTETQVDDKQIETSNE